MRTHAFRLGPGTDLKKSLETYVMDQAIDAGYILVCVGSLSHAVLRLAGAREYLDNPEEFEIVSAVGTLSMNGCHIHLSVSDSQGRVLGGHLMEGCVVRTTAEVVIGQDDAFQFNRKLDDATGFEELDVQPALIGHENPEITY